MNEQKQVGIQDVLSALGAEISQHREREAFHAAQEVVHREERARHAAELERLTKLQETLSEAASAAIEIARRRLPAQETEDLGSKNHPRLTRMVEKVVEEKKPDDPFGPMAVAREVTRRFGDRMRKPVDSRLVSIALRRLHERGQLQQIRPGRPHSEALYVRKGGKLPVPEDPIREDRQR
jgi:hypothetical protein